LSISKKFQNQKVILKNGNEMIIVKKSKNRSK